jgi:haloacetate dehalogenase
LRPVTSDSGALEAYLKASTTSEAITAMCECFRAGISCDCEDDRADLAAGRKIQCPTLVLWGEKGVVGRYFDMREVWQRWTHSVSFAPMPCGHFIPEEEAEIARNVISDFLAIS